MRWFFLIFTFLVVATIFGLRTRGDKFSKPPFEMFPDMDRQYKVKFQKPSHLFDNGMGSRRPVDGTVPMGFHLPISKEEGLKTSNLDFSFGDDYYNTGQFGDFYGAGYPETLILDEELLERGKQRYRINCTSCHGESGNGKGIVGKYWGFPPARESGQSAESFDEAMAGYNGIPPTANLLDARVKAFPEGQLFWTITHGKGLMGGYGATINVRDRWAIVAYVRALQAASN